VPTIGEVIGCPSITVFSVVSTNKIEADQSGTVTEILCNDGDGVEFGQTLIIIK
jgi:acetyl/propionyl-CoA carboxylase alpha subunit